MGVQIKPLPHCWTNYSWVPSFIKVVWVRKTDNSQVHIILLLLLSLSNQDLKSKIDMILKKLLYYPIYFSSMVDINKNHSNSESMPSVVLLHFVLFFCPLSITYCYTKCYTLLMNQNRNQAHWNKYKILFGHYFKRLCVLKEVKTRLKIFRDGTISSLTKFIEKNISLCFLIILYRTVEWGKMLDWLSLFYEWIYN